MRQQSTWRWAAGWTGGVALSASLLGACSLALDTDKNQCSKASDCDSKIGGSSTQLCVKGFCQSVVCDTGLSIAEQDQQCRAGTGRDELKISHCAAGICTEQECTRGGDECGDNATCDVQRGMCVDPAKASCGLPGSPNALDPNKDCANYEGLESYLCNPDKVCEKPDCRNDEDCAAEGDSLTCVDGACKDVTWGCTRMPDDREVPASGTATLRLQIVDLGMSPIKKENNLKVNVCAIPGGATCIPISSAKTSYDYETGFLSVSELQQKQRLWLEISSTGTAPVDWYSQRVPVGVTEETEPAVLVPVGIENTIGMQFEPDIIVDLETKSTMIIRMYNCNAQNGEGVSIAVTKALEDTKIFYLNATYQVLLDEQATDATGTAGIANAQAIPIRITATRDGALVTQFDLTPRTKRLTYLALYPSDYSM